MFFSELLLYSRWQWASSALTRLEAGGLSSENLGHDAGAAPLHVSQVFFRGSKPTEDYYATDRLTKYTCMELPIRHGCLARSNAILPDWCSGLTRRAFFEVFFDRFLFVSGIVQGGPCVVVAGSHRLCGSSWFCIAANT